MERSSSSAPNENGGSSSSVYTTSTATPPSFRLNVQTLNVPSVAHFLQLIQQNLYRVLRILVSQVQLSRFRNSYRGIRDSQYRSLEKIRQVHNMVTETLATYKGHRDILHNKMESVNLILRDLCRISTARTVAVMKHLNAVGRLTKLKKNLAFLNHSNAGISYRYRKLRLRQLIRKARMGVAKTEKMIIKLEAVVGVKDEQYRVANRAYEKAEKEFHEQHVSPYQDLTGILALASEEFERENLVHERQFDDLRRGLQNLQREHRMGILRTVPLLQLSNQQREESMQEASGSSENTYDWQNLIVFRVDVVIEVRTVTWVHY